MCCCQVLFYYSVVEWGKIFFLSVSYESHKILPLKCSVTWPICQCKKQLRINSTLQYSEIITVDRITLWSAFKLVAHHFFKAQSSWTKRAVEIDSPQAMSPDQLADPPDSTCAQVIHLKSDICSNRWLPCTSNKNSKKQKETNGIVCSTNSLCNSIKQKLHNTVY